MSKNTISITSKRFHIYLFLLRQVRWLRYGLYVIIPLLLLNCGIFTFFWSINVSDKNVQGLLLNISAGFVGSFFTFIILGLFEFGRSRITFLEFIVPYLARLTDITKATIAYSKNSETLIEQINRLNKIIDFENNPQQSNDIIRSQGQIIDHAIKEQSAKLSLIEDSLESIKVMLDQTVTLRHVELSNSLQELYKSCKANYNETKFILDMYTEFQVSLAKRQSQDAGTKS